MKKVLACLLLVVLLAGLVVYGVAVYREQRAYRVLIHNNTETLINVQVDGIIKSLVWNMLSNPRYYFKRDKNKGTRSSAMRESADHGLSVPSHVFIYDVKSLPGTWFSSLMMEDTVAFKKFAKKWLGLAQFTSTGPGQSRAVSADGRLMVMFTEAKAVFVISIHKNWQEAEPICADLLADRSCIPVMESSFFKDIKKKGHVLMAGHAGTASLQFKSGNITLDARLPADLVKGSDSLRPKKFREGSLVKMWLDADIHKLIRRQETFLRSNGLEADSLIRYYRGYLDFEWMDSMVIQRDTVVTYGYTDNFEKTEEKIVQENEVPEFYLALKASPHLTPYLPQRLVYQLHTGHRDGLVYAGTGNRYADEREISQTQDFFYLYANLEKLMQATSIPVLSAYGKTVKQLEVHARQTESAALNVRGSVTLLNADINSLMQLFLH